MSQQTFSGSCLCGAVRYQFEAPIGLMMNCHCSRCRKSTGTGHATNLTVQPEQFSWLNGEDHLSRYALPTAQSFGKWFCQLCGSPVPRLTQKRGVSLYVVPAGSLDGTPDLKPTDHLFWDSRAPWSCESGGLPTHADFPAAWGIQPTATEQDV